MVLCMLSSASLDSFHLCAMVIVELLQDSRAACRWDDGLNQPPFMYAMD